MSSWSRGSVVDNVPRNRIITSSNKPIVSVVLRSGLGNRLFQIMAGLGYAERCGKQFVFFEKQMHENFHTGAKLTKDLLLAIFPQVKIYRSHVDWNQYREDTDKFYDDYIIPDLSGSVLLHGFFQNAVHFPSDYRTRFKIPKPAMCKFNCDDVNWSKTFFIHYRKGDYVDSDYDVIGLDYYKTAIQQIQTMYNSPYFLIFSDQPDKVTVVDLLIDSEYKIVGNIGVWETLYLMSQCAGAICANSTFSWFGAYAQAGLGPVFMPSIWKKGFTKHPVPDYFIAI